MNVLDYSIRLGKMLRKTEEGKNLFIALKELKEKYAGNEMFREFEKYAENQSTQFYFFSWDIAYQTFLHVLEDDSIEHRSFFVPISELIKQDNDIPKLISFANIFGGIFEKIVEVCISGQEIEKSVPASWKYKMRNAISDVQVAVERTMLMKSMGMFYSKKPEIINNKASQEYLSFREKSSFLPFSKDAVDAIEEKKDISFDEKILYEKMFLVMEAIKKGIFYGFFGNINSIPYEELLIGEDVFNIPLQEVTFHHKNDYSSFLGSGWLYKIQLKNQHVYFMAHRKNVKIGADDEKTSVTGIVYPYDDRGVFDN